MRKMKIIITGVLLSALSASASVLYEVDFDTVGETLNDVKNTDNKIRFGGNSASQPSVGTNEWAGRIGDPATTAGRVSIVDDGSGANNVFHVNGASAKSTGGALVLAPEVFGGTASVAKIAFELTEFDRKGAGDASDGYITIHAASGYDLSEATDQKIIIQTLINGNGGVTVNGVNGAASASKIAEQSFTEDHTNATVEVSFAYDGSSAVIVAWESRNKTAFKFDDIVVSDDGVLPAEGDPNIVMFGGLTSVYDDVESNNAFVEQIGAGEIVQFNGLNSAGGSFGASGTLVNQGVGAALTNSLNGLVLTTTGIGSSNAVRTNTVSSAGQLGVNATGQAANFQQSDATTWSFDFNVPVELRQVVFSGMDANAKDRMRVSVNGVDYDLSPADTAATDAWSGNTKIKVYTFAEPVIALGGSEITIATHDGQSSIDPVNNKWGLFSVVVQAANIFDSLNLVDFGGNPDLIEDAAYQSEMGGDAVIAWWGGDDEGRNANQIGNLKDQPAGALLRSINYDLSIYSVDVSSSSEARTNTVVSGGQLGVNFSGSANASFEAVDATSWTFEFDSDVYLGKASFKGFTGGAEEAQFIINGTTNSIMVADTVPATYESANIYTFPVPLFIPAGMDVTVRCPTGKWGLANLLIGTRNELATKEGLYADWLDEYPGLGTSTNLTDNPDQDILDNLAEYALGGDPTDANDQGRTAVASSTRIEGVDYLEVVHYERSDAALRGLSYEIVVKDDLVLGGDWTNINHEVITGTVQGGFRSFTNRFPTAEHDKRFYRLDITLD